MLNNHGWGFRAYLIGSGVLLIALILATFLIMRLYSGLPNLADAVEGAKTYSTIEEDIKMYARDYITDYTNQDITTGVVTITTDKLIEKGFFEKKDLITESKDKCKGYALVKKDEEDALVVESYIKCDDYETNGYQSWRQMDE